MERRHVLAGLAASTVFGMSRADAAEAENTFLELKTWQLHNSAEDQGKRLAEYLEHGLAPALDRAGVKLDGAFGNVIGTAGPYYVTLVQYPNLGALGEVFSKLSADSAHKAALSRLASGTGAPFVRVESSVLRSFDVMPRVAAQTPSESPRIFELRTYESPSFTALTRKVGMFNNGEAKIFERLGMRPVFFGETLIGPKQPNLTYMLSYDNLAARDKLWQSFVSDPEWKKLSAIPELKDAEIVTNISNAILRPLAFSAIR